ncbi:MAG: Fe-S cluster assembly protein SufD [Bdellovibrionales bacterium]|nr:Fe-S cluster assembly protein SufD [Bdellovibrionales bacterium]
MNQAASKLNYTINTIEDFPNVELQKLRDTARTRLQELPFVTDKQELWRYTKPRQFDFSKLDKTGSIDWRLEKFDNERSEFQASGLTLSTGLKLSQYLDLLTQIFRRASDDLAEQSIIELQLAACSSVHVLHVARGTQIEEPVLIRPVVQDNSINAAVPLLVILIDNGASVKIVEELNFSLRGLYMPRVEIVARQGAQFSFASVQRLSTETQYLARHNLLCERDVVGDCLHLASGASCARVDLDCKMTEPGASLRMAGFYVSDQNRHVDFHTSQDHMAPHCYSELYYKGVVKDRARAVYYGYIKVAEPAQKTDAYQTNRNLLLSSEARADSIPNLAIKANDVKCSHGSSVGQVGEDELFYLMSRGLSRTTAEKLLIEAFFADLISRVKYDSLKEYVTEVILERLR